MGILDRILRRSPAASAEGERRIPPAPMVSKEQEQMNRDVMEAQMKESRQKRDDA